ncbi:MAG: beta-N-acetylhexosaminidase [Alphaproteobacteria bacterium]
MSRRSERAAAIVGVAGPVLGADERDLIAATRPLGFILFKRNCETPDQIAALTAALRDAVDDAEAPVLIDQEGGRVRRLQGPPWHEAPPAATFARLPDPDAGARAAWLNSRLIADDLTAMGVDVDCVPCLDLSFAQTHKVIGDRSYGTDVGTVVRLGGAAAGGLKAGGVMPVMKHLPGHGRATVDSHDSLPVVEADFETLAATDFAPFASLTDVIELGMTGHLMFPAIDPLWPSTLSATIVAQVIRDRIGFQGLLMSDDLSMQALAGDVGERAAGAIAAGCDIALHCNGRFDEMRAVLDACGPMSAAAHDRWALAQQGIARPEPFERTAAQQELAGLLASVPDA